MDGLPGVRESPVIGVRDGVVAGDDVTEAEPVGDGVTVTSATGDPSGVSDGVAVGDPVASMVGVPAEGVSDCDGDADSDGSAEGEAAGVSGVTVAASVST